MEVVINWWAIIISMVSAVVIGFFWYGPLFGKVWMKEAGIKMPENGEMPNMARPVIISMLGALFMAYVLAHGIAFGNAYLGMSGISAGLQGAFWFWLGFFVPAHLNFVAWEGHSWKRFMVYTGYWLALALVTGALVAGMA